MREIKFRLRDKEGNFHYASLFELISGKFQSWATAGTALEDEPPQQFIGLYDKNGKEIYEGDILKSETTQFAQNKQTIAVVEFEDGVFGIRDNFSFSSEMLKIYWLNNEVIGNIHENPELLENNH